MIRTAPSPTMTAGTILLVTAWFGLLTVLGDGAISLAQAFVPALLQEPWPDLGKLEWLFERIWMVGLMNLFLFLAFGVSVGFLVQRILKERALLFLVFLLASLMAWEWLLSIERTGLKAGLVLAAGIGVTTMRGVRSRRLQFVAACRRTVPWFALTGVCAALATTGGVWAWKANQVRQRPVADPMAPNILILVLDTLRADHLSALGYDRPTSPNIDRMAQAGVLFENGVAASSWTLPSHAAMLTGRYDHGAVLDSFDGRYPTLGEMLQQRGYRTGAFSANNWFFARWVGLGRGFDKFADSNHSLLNLFLVTPFGKLFKNRILFRNGVQDHPTRKRAPQVNREFLEWLQSHSQRPFFAFLNYYDPHDPYLPPEPYRSQFASTPGPGGLVNTTLGRPHPVLTAEQLQSEIDAYDGAIAYTDHHIGRLFEQLQAQGLLQNTIVVITSDHGESFGEHNLTGHRTSLYWDLLRVPIVVWATERVPAGVRIRQPVSIAALPATVLDLTGTVPRTQFSVSSLAPFWKGTQGSREDFPLAELVRMTFEARDLPLYQGSIQSVVSPQWHYILHETLGEELYDWVNDPREENSLADSPQGKAACLQLSRFLAKPPHALEKQ